jgi:hypothetical protein
MSFSVSSLSSISHALQASLLRMRRDAAAIASVPSLDAASAPAAAAQAPAAASDPTGDGDTTGAMVDLLVVQRAFAAQLRVLQVADRMAKDAIDIGRPRGD